jgi:hypothetical protein
MKGSPSPMEITPMIPATTKEVLVPPRDKMLKAARNKGPNPEKRKEPHEETRS